MKVFKGIFVVLAISGVWQANAATVTDCGTSICYTYDDAQTSVAVFGLPFIVADSLVFLPPAFRAESIDGVGIHTGTNIDTLSATFVLDQVASKSGDDLVSISVYEEGDYEIANGDRVGADLRLSVVNKTAPATFPPVPETGFADASFDASGDSGGLQAWNLQADFDLMTEFATATNAVGLSIQNTLLAETDAFGENAWIQKKITFTGSTAVPVPAAVWLFGSALGALGWIKRRRNVTA